MVKMMAERKDRRIDTAEMRAGEKRMPGRIQISVRKA
jgi:hypothetical protein